MSDSYFNEYHDNANLGPLRKYYFEELDQDSSKYDEQNLKSLVKFKEHQLTLLNKCIEHELNKYITIKDDEIKENCNDIWTNYGIIADKTGSGKSYVILALILLNKSLKREAKTLKNVGSFINYTKYLHYNECSCNIIVIPHNIKQQWVTYIENFSKKMKYILIDTNKSLTKIIEDWDTEYKFYDVIFVTGTFYRYLEELINSKKLKVSRVIFDEADTCRIQSCRKINAQFYWFVTASYKNLVYPYRYGVYNRVTRNREILTNGIENNKFIKEIFRCNLSYSDDVINKKILDNMIIKNKDSFVDASFSLPEIQYHTIICKEPAYLNLLVGIVSNQILQFLHAGDIKGAMECVNKSNINTEDNIIKKILEDYKVKLYNIKCTIDCANIITYNSEQDKINALQKLDEEKIFVTDRLKLLEDRLRTESNNCIICYDDIENKTITKCCNQTFCLNCITTWIKTKAVCPLCKNIINFDSLYYIDNTIKKNEINEIIDTKISNEYKYEENLKIDNLIHILTNSPIESKFLICSDYDNTFIEIEKKLKKNNILFDKIKGNHIANTVNKYKNGNLKVLLLNSKFYGSGLNLENTSDIILFHKVDSEIEKQSIGRAQRAFRTVPLNVWYLLHKSENH
jgi:hypothetical protein